MAEITETSAPDMGAWGSADEAARALLAIRGSKLPLKSFGNKRFGNYLWPGSKDGLVPPEYEELWQALGMFQREDILFLLLWGLPGVGKTHLAISLGWNMVGNGRMVQFYQVEHLLDTIRNSYDVKTTIEVLRSLEESDLLILDDFGAHAATEWSMAKLDAIIDHRYEHERKTIITTNSLDIPERIMDRCREGLIVQIRGKSQRGHVHKNK